MSEEQSGGGGGFAWGVILGGLVGLVAGAYLASGPGRSQVDSLRDRTIELTGRGDELRSRARSVVNPASPIGRAINEGVSAARRRRQELEAEDGATGAGGAAGESGWTPPAGAGKPGEA